MSDELETASSPAPSESRELNPRTPFVNDETTRLKKELELASFPETRGRLLYELGEICEQHGDEASAIRNYQESFAANPSATEALENVIRLLEKKRARSSLSKPYADLISASKTAEERARALVLRAHNLEDVARDYAGAKDLLREATESGATPVDIASAWLSLEIVAAKLGDETLRAEALLGRASHAASPDWRGMLHVAAARTYAELGEIERALPLLDRVVKEEGHVTFHAIQTAIRLLEKRRVGADAHPRLPEYLERAAVLVEGALTSGARARAIGLPEWLENLDAVIDFLLRAADLHEANGKLDEASRVLDTGLVLTQGMSDSPSGARASLPPKDAGKSSLERLLLTRRMRVAELMGDDALAAKLASRRLIGEDDGGVAASLSIRVAEEAASKGDAARATKALSRAMASDPESIPARALQMDLLARDSNVVALASEIERCAALLPTPAAQSRAFLLSAYLWGARVKDAGNAKAALAQALTSGAEVDAVARESRMLAAILGDDEWYADATRQLLSAKLSDLERALLWFEILRARLMKNDGDGAKDALRELGATEAGAYVATSITAMLPELADWQESLRALDSLVAQAEGKPHQRSLWLYAALRAHSAGDVERATNYLRKLVSEGDPDPLVLSYLIDLTRAGGDSAAVAALVASGAHAVSEGPLAAGLHMEAGLERWALGDRVAAAASFETARDIAPAAAEALVSWSLRALSPDNLDSRRHANDVASDIPRDATLVAFDRFSTESAAGKHEEARSGLGHLGENASRDFQIARSLAYLISPNAAADDPAIVSALRILESIGSETEKAAAAERARLSRTSAPRDLIDATHAWVETGGGTEAKLEWLAASIAGGDTASELAARESLADSSETLAAELLRAQSKLIEACTSEGQSTTFARGASAATRLANLELAPPGTDPRRRRAALTALRGTCGEAAVADTQALSGWSALLAGDAEGALSSFLAVTKVRERDLSAWEGVRTAAARCGRRDAAALACEQLGARLSNDARGAAFWEEAGFGWFALGPRYEDRGERALDAAFRRDPRRKASFDKLFRRVRERKNLDRLLFLIETRLRVATDQKEVVKLHWEEARVRREKGDPEGAMRALERVTEIEPEHVGALALTGEIFIRRGMYAEAADRLSRLSRAEGAPAMNRVTAGVTAVDLFENKLDRFDLALDVLNALHESGLSTLPVRERLARAAARTGSWNDATRILEELMMERPTPEGRVEAARLAAAIHRDRLGEPFGAMPALQKLLQEIPGDAEGIDALLEIADGTPATIALLARARETFVRALETHPGDTNMVNRLARVTHAMGDTVLEQAAWSVAVALAGSDIDIELRLRQIDAATSRVPTAALTDAAFQLLCAPGDDGPMADLFKALGPTLADAFGPNATSLGVTKRDRVDPRSGLAIHNEIASWGAAFGIRDLEVYIGGKDPMGIEGMNGSTPAIVIGPEVNVPLSLIARARLGRELLGIVRGTNITRLRDDSTISAIVIASCALAKIPVKAPPNAALAEVERLLNKAMSRKVRTAIEPICLAIVKSKASARAWAARARLSQSRAGVVASGSVAAVLADLFNEPMEDLGSKVFEDLRSEELMRFILSPYYAELRVALGLNPRES